MPESKQNFKIFSWIFENELHKNLPYYKLKPDRCQKGLYNSNSNGLNGQIINILKIKIIQGRSITLTIWLFLFSSVPINCQNLNLHFVLNYIYINIWMTSIDLIINRKLQRNIYAYTLYFQKQKIYI